MTSQVVIQIGRELLITAMLLALPTVLASLIVGILVSIAQTVTSIQEQTLNFAPRILAVGVVLILTLPWMLKMLVHFSHGMFFRMAMATQ